MPTRPSRRERRRADRRNAKQVTAPVSQTPMSAATTALGSLAPSVFMNAVPVVRTVMRLVLIQMSFTKSQAWGLDTWRQTLEMERPPPSAPEYHQHEYHILCFEAIVELHDLHVQNLERLQLEYAKQVVMWGLECSKAEDEWDVAFNERRRLELAQLNRKTKTLAVMFEEKLQKLLENEYLFASQIERDGLLGALGGFRDNFAKGVEVADEETAAALKRLEV